MSARRRGAAVPRRRGGPTLRAVRLRGTRAVGILGDVIEQARFYFYYGPGSPAAVGRA